MAAAPGRAKSAADLMEGPVSEQERFSAGRDGELSNAKVERFALFLADDIPATAAWKLAGYTSETGYAKTWRRRVEMDPVFRERVRQLTEEREASEASASPFEKARWAASQLWRDARAKDDLRGSEKAADLLFKIAERQLEYDRAVGTVGFAPAPAGGAKGPGRPAVEIAQAGEKKPSELAARLLARPRSEEAA